MMALRSKMRSLHKDEQGAAIVELAMVIVPFLMIMFALMDFSYRIYVEVVADSVVHRVTREATTGAIAVSDVEDSVNKRLDPVLLSGVDVNVETKSYYQFTGIGKSERITVDANNNGQLEESDCFIDENSNASFDSDIGLDGLGGANDVVVYKITIESRNLTPMSSFLGLENDFSVVARSTGRNQPFAAQVQHQPQEYCVSGGANVAV